MKRILSHFHGFGGFKRFPINILLARKHDAPEMGLAPRVELRDAFIQDDLARIEATSPQSAPHAQAPVAVDALFHATVDEVVRAGDAV